MKKLMTVLSFVAFILLSMNTIDAQAKAFDPNNEFTELDLRFWNDEKPDERFYINAASRYILETVKEPQMGSTFGEWSVMDLARGMYTGTDYINYIPSNYFTNYKASIDTYVKNKAGELDRNKTTEWSRLTLSMSALGYPITNIAGYDFVDRLAQSYKFSYRQGINGPIWEIIALNTGDYELPKIPSKYAEGDINTVGRMIDYIINKEITTTAGVTGGWALMNKVPDPDITGMALQALAPYYLNAQKYEKIKGQTTYPAFQKAVERAILAMSKMQLPGGAFSAYGNVNAESTTQVIVALSALNIDPKVKEVALNSIDETAYFNQQAGVNDGVTTDNMIDNLLTFFSEGSGSSAEVGGFKHVTTGYDGGGGSGTGVNAMATDQALYGLIAYDRFKNKENSLYNMTDQTAGQYKSMKAKKYTLTLYDGDAVKTVELAPYATFTMPQNDSAENGKLISWNSKETEDGTVYLPAEKLVMPEQNIALYAQHEVKTYSISYELNGGQFTSEPISSYQSTAEVSLPTATNIKKEDAIFLGWYSNPQWNDRVISSVAKGSNGDKTYYAKWASTNEKVAEVNALIATLPTTIKVKHKELLENSRIAYDQLTAEEQAGIVNYGKLLDAELQLAILEKDSNHTLTSEEKAARILALINTLPATATLTLQDQSLIADVRAAYNQLSAKEKMLISNYSVLLKAEKAFNQLSTNEVDTAVASDVSNLISSLPASAKLTLKDEEQLLTVRTAFDVITLSQQKLVSNYNKLLQAELQMQLLIDDAKLLVSPLKNNATVLKGSTLSKQQVQVYVNDKKIGTQTTNAKNEFAITVGKLKAGTKIVVKTAQATKTLTVMSSKLLAAPKANKVGAKSTSISGTALKSSKIVAKVNNKVIGNATVTKKGIYTMKIKAQKKGTKIKLTISDALNNPSKQTTLTVIAAKTLATPSVNKVNEKSTTLSGKALQSATVIAKVNGKEIAKTQANRKGQYKVKMKAQKKGAKITVFVRDHLNNTSKSKVIKVAASKVLSGPKVKKVTTKTTKIQGSAIKSANIILYNAKGKRLATTKVSAKGKFTIAIKKQKKHRVFYVQVTDALNNKSKRQKITVQ